MKTSTNERLPKDKGHLPTGNSYPKCSCRKVLEKTRGTWCMLDVPFKHKVIQNLLARHKVYIKGTHVPAEITNIKLNLIKTFHRAKHAVV